MISTCSGFKKTQRKCRSLKSSLHIFHRGNTDYEVLGDISREETVDFVTVDGKFKHRK